MFTEVYKDMPTRLQRQQEECFEHIKKYPKDYPVDKFKKWFGVWNLYGIFNENELSKVIMVDISWDKLAVQ